MKKSVIQILACYILWGILPIFWKTLSELDAFYVLSCRIIWSAVFCLAIIIVTKDFDELKKTLKDKKQMKYLLCSGVMIAINWGFYIYAVNAGHILDASLAYYLNPLFAIAIGFVFFKEKIAKSQWVAIGIAVLGIMVAIIGYQTVPVFALIIGGSFAIYGAIKKSVHCSGMISTFIEATILSPFALVCIGWMEHNGIGAVGVFEGAEFLLLPAAGVVTSIPLLAYSSGITKVPMSLSGILMYVNPTLQFIIGAVLYGETFDLPKIIMFVCVWLSLIIFVSQKKVKE